MTDYEDISGGGTYHKWEQVGEVLEGVILSLSMDGGTDFNGNACPEMRLRADYGDVILTAGQASLRRALSSGSPSLARGHKVRIEYTEDLDTGKGNPAKIFKVQASKEPVMRGDRRRRGARGRAVLMPYLRPCLADGCIYLVDEGENFCRHAYRIVCARGDQGADREVDDRWHSLDGAICNHPRRAIGRPSPSSRLRGFG